MDSPPGPPRAVGKGGIASAVTAPGSSSVWRRARAASMVAEPNPGSVKPGVTEDARMLTHTGSTILRNELGVEETIESDNIVRWDGDRLYVEQDVYHNGQLVHRKYRRTVTEPVARVLWDIINRAKQ